MEDLRKNNGGNSTKSKGFDKRKNEYKDILNDALTETELIYTVRMLYNKAIDNQDTTAAKIILEYYLGRPKQIIEQTNIDGGTKINAIFKEDILNIPSDSEEESHYQMTD